MDKADSVGLNTTDFDLEDTVDSVGLDTVESAGLDTINLDLEDTVDSADLDTVDSAGFDTVDLGLEDTVDLDAEDSVVLKTVRIVSTFIIFCLVRHLGETTMRLNGYYQLRHSLLQD